MTASTIFNYWGVAAPKRCFNKPSVSYLMTKLYKILLGGKCPFVWTKKKVWTKKLTNTCCMTFGQERHHYDPCALAWPIPPLLRRCNHIGFPHDSAWGKDYHAFMIS